MYAVSWQWHGSLSPNRTLHILSIQERVVVLLVVDQARNQYAHVEDLVARPAQVEARPALAALWISHDIYHGSDYVNCASEDVCRDVQVQASAWLEVLDGDLDACSQSKANEHHSSEQAELRPREARRKCHDCGCEASSAQQVAEDLSLIYHKSSEV